MNPAASATSTPIGGDAPRVAAGAWRPPGLDPMPPRHLDSSLCYRVVKRHCNEHFAGATRSEQYDVFVALQKRKARQFLNLRFRHATGCCEVETVKGLDRREACQTRKRRTPSDEPRCGLGVDILPCLKFLYLSGT